MVPQNHSFQESAPYLEFEIPIFQRLLNQGLPSVELLLHLECCKILLYFLGEFFFPFIHPKTWLNSSKVLAEFCVYLFLDFDIASIESLDHHESQLVHLDS